MGGHSAADVCKSDLDSQWSAEVRGQTRGADDVASREDTTMSPLPNDNGGGTVAVMSGTLGGMDGPLAIRKPEDRARCRMPRAASQPHLSTAGLPHHDGPLSNDLHAHWRSEEDLPAECTGRPQAVVGTCKQGHEPRGNNLVEHWNCPTNRGPEMSRPGNSSWAHRLLETPPVAGLPSHVQPHHQPSDFPMYFDLKL